MDQFGVPIRIALAILATWRVTHLLSSEDGPGDVIFHLRAKLGSSFAGKLMDCFYCLSLWVERRRLAIVLTRHWIELGARVAGFCPEPLVLLEHSTQERTVVQKFSIEGEDSHGMLRSEERQPENESRTGR